MGLGRREDRFGHSRKQTTEREEKGSQKVFHGATISLMLAVSNQSNKGPDAWPGPFETSL